MAKDKTEQIIELMRHPRFIRNMSIAAHIDHGKCVSGDTKIALSDGTHTAKALFERLSAKGKPVQCCDDEVYDVSDSDVVVNSIDSTTGKHVISKITHVWRLRKTEPLVNVKLKNGLCVKTTPEHRFLVFDGSSIQEKRADYLSMKDVLVCPLNLEYSELTTEEMKSWLLSTLSTDYNFFVSVDNEMAVCLHKKILAYGREKVWKQTNSKLKMLSFYHGSWRGSYRLGDLLSVAALFGIPFGNIYDSIESINYRGYAQRGVHSSINLKLPKSYGAFVKFFYIAGVMFGDGNTEGNVDNTDKEIHKMIIDFCYDVFGIKVRVKQYGNKCPRIMIGNETFKKLLNVALGFPLKKKSLNIRTPAVLERVPLDMCASFIRGYFDTDGTIEKGRSAVSICSASVGMMQDLQLLLLRFGLASQFYEHKKSVYISGKQGIERFKDSIGFCLSHKNQRMNNLLDVANLSRNILYPAVAADSRQILLSLTTGDVYFSQIAEITRCDAEDFVYDFTVENTHNFVANGMIVHNTTLTDNLVAGAGMISEDLAGQQLFTDFDKQEQERGITIFSANVSMVHEVDDQPYLINLIDTPGHVDFGGDVTRAMRAVDGTVIVVDAVEAIMPQTETVLRQALRERVKPVLFVNKVDRLIKELQLTPEKMQERFLAIITQVNRLIQKYAETEFAEKWLVNVEDGSVAFGSAYRNWAISFPYMKKNNITFKQVIEYCETGKDKEFSKIAPLHKIVLNMVTKHLPNPADAQKYRIKKLWHGDINSDIGKSMINMDYNGPLAMIITKVNPDPHAGLVATARIFSGVCRKGEEVRLVSQHMNKRLQQVSIYKGPQRIQMDEVPAGNIVGIVGLTDAFSGETVCSADLEIEPFEEIKHLFEPVVTKSIEPKDPKDLPKLIMLLKQTSREDPTLVVKINEETGEYLVSGLGELHLDAKIERPLKEKGINITASPPIVIYRETVRSMSPEIEGKSSNKHNRFYTTIEPVPQEIYDAIASGKIREDNIKKHIKEVVENLVEAGMSRDEAKKVQDIYNRNILVDATKGIQYLNETMELVIEAFRQVMNSGPLANEPCSGMLIKLHDAKLHEDAIHRGPAQVIPAVNDALKEAILKAKPTLLEPVQTIRIDVPEELVGSAMTQVQNRRGQIVETTIEYGAAIVKAKLPTAEMFGFEAVLKSATGGKGFYSLVDVAFERLPEDLKTNTVGKIRERKGLSKDIAVQ